MNSAKVIYLPSHCSCTHKILHVHGLIGSLAWASDQAGLARSSPATRAGLGPARKKNSSKIFSKICDFPQIFYCILINIGFVFLYCKDTNLVLKYPVFVKTLKKTFCFHAYDQVSQK
jgi:hypothetical protein